MFHYRLFGGFDGALLSSALQPHGLACSALSHFVAFGRLQRSGLPYYVADRR